VSLTERPVCGTGSSGSFSAACRRPAAGCSSRHPSVLGTGCCARAVWSVNIATASLFISVRRLLQRVMCVLYSTGSACSQLLVRGSSPLRSPRNWRRPKASIWLLFAGLARTTESSLLMWRNSCPVRLHARQFGSGCAVCTHCSCSCAPHHRWHGYVGVPLNCSVPARSCGYKRPYGHPVGGRYH
jgi:hypothetical protein